MHSIFRLNAASVKKIMVFSITSFALLMFSCDRWPAIYKKSKSFMSTIVTITAVGPKRDVEKAMDAAFSEIERLDRLMSAYKIGSDVDRINKSAGIGPVKVDKDVLMVILKAKEISKMTDGAFDITIGPLSDLWGFGVKDNYLPETDEIKKLLPLVDYRQIKIDDSKNEVFLNKKRMKIDLGGIAKGYAAERGVEILKEKGIKAGIVAVAGDIRVFGRRLDNKPWHIGIRHPREKDKLITAIDLENSAISTAGDYERFFMKDGIRYHHILDPKTGYPAVGCQSVSIISSAGILSDSLSTGIFVLGPKKGMALIEAKEEIKGIIVGAKGNIMVSSGLKVKVEP